MANDWIFRAGVPAALPTLSKMNAFDPADAEYYYEDQIAYVLEKTLSNGKKVYRVFTSSGGSLGYKLGDKREYRSDQTCRTLGYWTVVGITNFKTMERQGLIPNRSFIHWVCK
jgi:hypothetical protein